MGQPPVWRLGCLAPGASVDRGRSLVWRGLALSVVISILNLFGMLCCLVGLLVTVPISILATMYAYETVIHGRKVE